MVSVDEHTQVGIEIVSEGSKLTGELILKILQSVNDLLQRENDKQDFILKDNTKEGKQSIKDLIKKHQDGVMAFDDNLTKEQVSDYQKVFKKMGVDFSIVKNDENSYSFFFASKDANVIEKSLKNIIEMKNKMIEKENPISEQSETNDQEIRFKKSLMELSPQELALFTKINEIDIANKSNMNDLDEIKSNLSNEQISNIEKLYKENVFIEEHSNVENKIPAKEIAEIEKNLEKEINPLENKQSKIQKIQDEVSELPPKEKKLFEIMNELKEIESEITNEKLMNIQYLHEEYSSLISTSKEEQLDNIFQQLSPEEKEYFIKINDYALDSSSMEKMYIISEASENLSIEQISKVDALYDNNIYIDEGKAPEGYIHKNDVEKLTTYLTDLTNDEESLSSKQEIKQINNKYLEKFEDKTIEEIDYIINQKEKGLDYFLSSIPSGENKDKELEQWNNTIDKMKEAKSIILDNKNQEKEVSEKFSAEEKVDTKELEGSEKNVDRKKEKQIDKVDSPKVFSIKGVQEISRKIKEQEQDNDKDKKRSQTLSR
ncbi:hypothetical protein ACQJ0Y_14645 [Peribacillus simplex]|uniref:hypothetical protein n=1 Tax=Peribacillus simplex TaxID=1478 RepID=UPI003CFB58DB